MALRPADNELLEKINKALAEMESDGVLQSIYKWLLLMILIN